MQSETDYLVRNQKIIFQHLTDVFKYKCILTVHFGENNTSFMTAILELDTKNNILKFDCAPSEPLNKQLLNSAKVLFRTQIEGVKVSFSGKNIKLTKNRGQAAFEMPIPNSIFWMQRRQFYRVRVPLSHAGTYCKIIFRTQAEDEFEPSIGRTATLVITDISINGFALLNPDAELADHFIYDKSFNECCMSLHEGPSSNIAFVVKDISLIKINTLANQQRIGCRITEISTSFESAIQRYMQDIERQQKNIG